MMINRLHLALVSTLSFAASCAGAFAEDGVFKDKIVFGQVAALDGPAQALGKGMQEGIITAFDEINRTGGIKGRQLELKSVDDGYEPEKTIAATKSPLSQEKVFPPTASVGTPR